jgi:pimeloyl-ACP methyl ester carboxylesterase
MPDALVARYLAPYVGRDGLEHLVMLGRAIQSEDVRSIELDQLDHSTVIVWGDQDRWVNPKLPQRLAGAIPGARLIRLTNAARLVPEDEPEAFTNILLESVGAASVV